RPGRQCGGWRAPEPRGGPPAQQGDARRIGGGVPRHRVAPRRRQSHRSAASRHHAAVLSAVGPPAREHDAGRSSGDRRPLSTTCAGAAGIQHSRAAHGLCRRHASRTAHRSRLRQARAGRGAARHHDARERKIVMTRVSVGIDLSILGRRQLLGGAAAAGAAAMLPWNRALAQTKVNFGYMKIGDLSPFFMATEKGFFKEGGLEIALSSMVGGAAIQPALASVAISVGWTNVVSMCYSHLTGFSFRFIANDTIVKLVSANWGTHGSPGLMVGVDSAIKTGKDLEGKIVAINTLGNITQATAMAWVDKHGGDSSKLKWVEMPMPQMAPALLNKQ